VLTQSPEGIPRVFCFVLFIVVVCFVVFQQGNFWKLKVSIMYVIQFMILTFGIIYPTLTISLSH
jgi:hypothetical protein